MSARDAGARSAEDDMLSLSNQLCFAVYSTANAFNRLYAELLGGLDVTYTQYLVLLVLWERDGIAVRELGERLSLDSGTLTPLLKRLERRGLILRRRDEDDQRRVLVSLTDEGRAIRERAREIPRTLIGRSGLTPESVRRLQGELEILRRGLLASVDAPRD